jgi:predicted DNA-binding transcriptional regulator YafY
MRGLSGGPDLVTRRTRLFDLVHLLSGRRARSIQDIVDHLSVSERTVYRDLAELQEIRVPIVRDDGGYRVLESGRMRPLALTGEERALLRLALDNPLLTNRPELALTLRRLRDKLEAVSGAVEETPPGLTLASIDRTGQLPDGLLAALERAVTHRFTLELRYISLSGRTAAWRRVDPYAVVHRADAWYLVGHCHKHTEPRTFRVDRVQESRPSGDTFERPLGFDLEQYFEDSWAIYRGKRRHHIVLRFPPALSAFILSAQHHKGEQKEVLPDGRVEYRVTLNHLAEVRRWVLGFGGQVEVVAPKALRSGGGEGE